MGVFMDSVMVPKKNLAIKYGWLEIRKLNGGLYSSLGTKTNYRLGMIGDCPEIHQVN